MISSKGQTITAMVLQSQLGTEDHCHGTVDRYARTHGLENMPGCSATEQSIEEIDGRWAEITEISGNILFFFFFFLKKTSPIQGECFSWY